MNAHEVLVAARAKIAKPENWCHGTAARSACGAAVSPSSDTACQWYSIGALNAVSKTDKEFDAAYRALSRCLPPLKFDCAAIAVFNDAHTHDEVLALFDRAIEATAS